MILDIVIILLIITVTVLINSRIYWLVKVKKEDPLKSIQPFFINEHDEKVNSYFEKG